MAIKKVDALPPVTRGVGGSTLLSAEDVQAMKDSPAEWFLVREKATSPQSYATFVKNNNPKGATKDEGPWKYATRAVGKVKNSKGAEVRAVDVYMTYDPEGKAKK